MNEICSNTLSDRKYSAGLSSVPDDRFESKDKSLCRNNSGVEGCAWWEKDDFQSILECVPIGIREIVYYFLLSDVKDKKTILEEFLKCGIDSENKILANVHNPLVYQIFRKARSVRRQIHKWKGVLRFKEIEGGYLYASFSSEFDIIYPLAKHFGERFNTERLLIHDLGRDKAVYVESGSIYHIEFFGMIPPESDAEKFFCRLWKLYFNSVSIEERKNEGLQNRCLPRKFQNWLCEFSNNELKRIRNTAQQLELF
ncbi:MAG: TIGR03915 family putative DNA repair protein [Candidatus Hydrogenedentes bacterium]|nr:TIGR03915 family putative DNA repair protein [Candidatus Hydrogenedentota bacterium]